MQTLGRDVRLALRRLGRARGFTVTVLSTLGLGIGLATAVLTVAEALLLRRLPVADQDRLVVLAGEAPDRGVDHVPLGIDQAREFAAGAPALVRVALLNFEGAAPVTIREGGRITRLRRSLVTGDYFAALGADAQLGRTLRPEDDAAGAAPVVVLSHRAWQRYFGGTPDVVGRGIATHEDGRTATVVGVMPPGLDYPRGVDAWAPVRAVIPPAAMRYMGFDILGRLAPGATPAAARAALTAYFQRDGAPPQERLLSGVARPLPELVLGRTRPAVLAFGAAAGLLLLIACVNVANLLLVRGLARAQEVAVRRALGAARGRIVGELLTEHALLAAAGGALGVAVAALAVRAFVALAPAGLPRLDEVHLDATALAGAVGLTAVATLLFAVAPVVWAARTDARLVVGAAGRQTGGRPARVAREALVALQVALAVLVLAAAGLVGRSLLKLEHVDLAFDPTRVVVAELALRADRYPDAGAQAALLDRLVAAIEALPGVQGASPVVSVPYSEVSGWKGRPALEGQSDAEAATNPLVDLEVVGPSFFRALGIPMRHGRAFTDADRAGAPLVAVVSEGAAARYWPGADPLGRRLVVGRRGAQQLATVVGVVPDTRYRDLREARATVYFPLRQSFFPFAPTTLVLRTTRAPDDAASALRGVLAAEATDVTLAGAAPVDALLAAPLAQPRMNAVLLIVFAAAAVGLAAVGLFGVLATMVRLRTRELGIRMALGATAGAVAQLVVGRGLALAAVGAGVGLLGALLTTRLLGALLYDVSPLDPWTLGGVAALVFGVAALAALLPARASSRIAPAAALRAE